MDRKGKQKLKRYFIVYVIFAVFFTVGMYLITKYEENAKATQIALLLAEHPELEGEIVAIWEKSGTVDFIRDRDDQKIERVVQMLEETYGYHSGSGSSDVVIRIIWGIGLLVGVIVCSLFLYLDRRKNWSRYGDEAVSYTHLRAHETRHDLVCRLLLEKKKNKKTTNKKKTQQTKNKDVQGK